MNRTTTALLLAAGASCLASPAFAQTESRTNEPVIVADGVPYQTWADYVASPQFQIQGLRCSIPSRGPAS